MTATLEGRLISELFAKIEAEIEQLKESLIDAVAMDYPGYRARVGHVRGMRRTLEIWNEVQDASKQDESKPTPDLSRAKIDYEG